MAVKKIYSKSGKVISHEMTCKIEGRVVRRRFKTAKEARAAHARLTTDAAEGTYVHPGVAKTSLGEYGRQWLASRQVRPSTLANYTSYWQTHIEPALGHLEIRQVTRPHITALVTALSERGLAPATVRHVHRILAMVLSEAVEDGLRPSSPCRRIALPKITKRELAVFTPEDVTKLLEAALPQHVACIATAFGTGLRQGELLGLTDQHVDLGVRQISVAQQLVTPAGSGQPFLSPDLKTAASRRTVPLPEFVVHALRTHLETFGTGEHGLLFVNPQGRGWRRGSFNDSVWKPTLRRAGLSTHYGIHAARHTFASSLAHDGIDVPTVQHLLGHESATETLNTYYHRFPGAGDHATRALDMRYTQHESDDPAA